MLRAEKTTRRDKRLQTQSQIIGKGWSSRIGVEPKAAHPKEEIGYEMLRLA
jgi:hypothetical protein